MNILHVASFAGNIGDNANHTGMRKKFQEVFPGRHKYSELEIRKCYRIYTGSDRWFFNSDFADLANQHDLVLIGGGNFFEPWLTESSTGTTIDIPDETLSAISVPLIFYGVGFDTYKNCPDVCKNRFYSFIEKLGSRPGTWVTFRNDGSMGNFISTYGKEAENVTVVPDGGFFFVPKGKHVLPVDENKKYWGVNVASDMKDIRFPEKAAGIPWESFLQQYASYLMQRLSQEPGLNLIFLPHIYKDIEAISQLLSFFDDRYCRERIVVAPYLHGYKGADYIFSIYRKCELVMGMRFHTNVCCLGMKVPVIPLATSPKLTDLYNEIGIEAGVVRANGKNFISDLELAIENITNKKEKIENALEALEKQLNRSADNFWKKVKAGV